MHFTSLFLCGSLLSPERRIELLGRAHPYVEKCSVRGYSVADERPYPALKADAGNVLEGLLTIIHETELDILDEYVMEGYVKRMIDTDGGESAWALMKK